MPDIQAVPAATPIHELIGAIAQSHAPLPVVAEDGRLLGTISKNTLLKFLDRTTDADGNPLPTATAEPAAHPAPVAAEPA